MHKRQVRPATEAAPEAGGGRGATWWHNSSPLPRFPTRRVRRHKDSHTRRCRRQLPLEFGLQDVETNIQRILNISSISKYVDPTSCRPNSSGRHLVQRLACKPPRLLRRLLEKHENGQEFCRQVALCWPQHVRLRGKRDCLPVLRLWRRQGQQWQGRWQEGLTA